MKPLIKPIGFVAALIVLVVIYVRVIYRRSYLTTIATAAACALSFWFLFVKLLGLRLPAGSRGRSDFGNSEASSASACGWTNLTNEVIASQCAFVCRWFFACARR